MHFIWRITLRFHVPEHEESRFFFPKEKRVFPRIQMMWSFSPLVHFCYIHYTKCDECSKNKRRRKKSGRFTFPQNNYCDDKNSWNCYKYYRYNFCDSRIWQQIIIFIPAFHSIQPYLLSSFQRLFSAVHGASPFFWSGATKHAVQL